MARIAKYSKLNNGKHYARPKVAARMAKYKGTTVEHPLVLMGDGFTARIGGVSESNLGERVLVSLESQNSQFTSWSSSRRQSLSNNT